MHPRPTANQRGQRSWRLLGLLLLGTGPLAVATIVGAACAPPVAAGREADPPASEQQGGALTGAEAAALSDEFSGSTLAPSWTIFNGAGVAVTVSGGALHLVPSRSLLWFNGSQGTLVYKLVSGNFKATTTAHTRKASDPSQPPSLALELGGVMLRSPASPPESYTFIVLGLAEQGRIASEWKDTLNSTSTFDESPWTPDSDLRICRIGSTVAVYRRHVGDPSWGAPFFQTARPDLPQTLQVGLNMYANQNVPDLDASFDRITFAPANTLGDCASDGAAVAPVPALSRAGAVVAALALAALASITLARVSFKRKYIV